MRRPEDGFDGLAGLGVVRRAFDLVKV